MIPLAYRALGRAYGPLLRPQRRFVVKLAKNTDEYHASLKASELVIAKFGASWCKPCRKSKAFVEELSEEHPDVLFLEVDVDELPQIADEEGVNSIPMYKVFKYGKSIDVHIGGDKQQLKDLIAKHASQ
ncbi:thioredoxin domain containing protein, putative [Babesia bigemina]|uniref:Thioredoxin domain containing protein, putative n=1 Tax=Babesia bigemina TaxID=5866 RepID=A0A061CZ86_BABBI|nr:thioredoxin domain containing protein, putative [Babesia bigemina]CDR93743.1 thioredoxin domain containing protein, putative [Babesia bigemina]|eukprot:XP_012765929.1 thioredoxin domain containing protein, putative [Babesia bigemina]